VLTEAVVRGRFRVWDAQPDARHVLIEEVDGASLINELFVLAGRTHEVALEVGAEFCAC